jgi:hypothetical protein
MGISVQLHGLRGGVFEWGCEDAGSFWWVGERVFGADVDVDEVEAGLGS